MIIYTICATIPKIKIEVTVVKPHIDTTAYPDWDWLALLHSYVCIDIKYHSLRHYSMPLVNTIKKKLWVT